MNIQESSKISNGVKIYLASDHAGFELKENIKIFLKNTSHEVIDLGAFVYTEGDDYPDFILPLAKEIEHDLKAGSESKGIIFGGSGEGEAMVANRVDGVRATVYYGGSKDIITLSREHNNANILSLGARFISIQEAQEVITIWLNTPFTGEARHIRRIMKF